MPRSRAYAHREESVVDGRQVSLLWPGDADTIDLAGLAVAWEERCSVSNSSWCWGYDHQYTALRLAVLAHKRATVVRLRDERRIDDIVLRQIRDALAGVLPYCREQGIAFLPFSPLGRGFLTGRFASPDDLPCGDFRRGLPRFQQDALRANLAIVERVRQVARRAGATPAQVALAWVLAQGRYVVPIPGTKTPRYLADNAGAADTGLSAADLAELDALPAPQGARY
jgi:hypothetical protein